MRRLLCVCAFVHQVYLPAPVTALLNSTKQALTSFRLTDAVPQSAAKSRKVPGSGLSYERFFSRKDKTSGKERRKFAGMSLIDLPVDKYRRLSEGFRRRHKIGEFAESKSAVAVSSKTSKGSKRKQGALSTIDAADDSFDEEETVQGLPGTEPRAVKKSVKPPSSLLKRLVRTRRRSAADGDDSDFLSDSDDDSDGLHGADGEGQDDFDADLQESEYATAQAQAADTDVSDGMPEELDAEAASRKDDDVWGDDQSDAAAETRATPISSSQQAELSETGASRRTRTRNAEAPKLKRKRTKKKRARFSKQGTADDDDDALPADFEQQYEAAVLKRRARLARASKISNRNSRQAAVAAMGDSDADPSDDEDDAWG